MAERRASLAEIMGTHAAASGGLQLSRLHEVLGNAMPELPRNPVGRHRLISALSQRFGPNFRTLPGVTGLMKQFDSEVELEVKMAKIRSIRPNVPKGK